MFLITKSSRGRKPEHMASELLWRYIYFSSRLLCLIRMYVSYSAEISHLAVGCREGISLLVSDWLSQLSHRWAQSSQSDTAAHSHRQKYPANWMAYVSHSPQGTAPRASLCITERQTVGEWKRETAGKQTKKCLFPLLCRKSLSVGGGGN